MSSNGEVAESRGAAALKLAKERGWYVFPLHYAIFDVDGSVRCSCRLGAACGKDTGKHPLTKNGFKNATNDPQQITTLWKAYPDANIGVATGAKSGIFVVDGDPRHGGDETLKPHSEDLGTELIVLTGGGGHHFYYKYDPEHPVDSRAGVLRGIDVRGDGGYVVGPGSNHASGGHYEFQDAGDHDPGSAPTWVRVAIDAAMQGDRESGFHLPDVVREGRRDDTATAFAGAMRHNRAKPETILAALRAENAAGRFDPPLEDHDLQRIANSAAKWPVGWPRKRTDSANAERLAFTYGTDLRHVAMWGRWFWWDGQRWAADETQRIQRLAKATARAIPHEIREDEDDKETKDNLYKWATSSEMRARREAMIALASAEPGIASAVADFDTDTMLFNVLNGTIDLRTGKLLPHRREDMITKLAPVEFNPDAECPVWLAFLDRIFDHNQRVIDYMQRVVGYCLTGSVKEEVYFFLYGVGQNGKTKFREAVQGVMGDYAKPADFTSFTTRIGEGPRNDIARLVGARAVMVSEVAENRRLDESLMKEITGGDKITARFLNHEFFDFYPQFKLIFAGNHKPIIKGTDPGMWRRPQVITFAVKIPDGEQDKALGEKLKAEASGILAWAVKGCLEWQRIGLKPPPEVTAATKMYRDEMDVMADFFSECCVEAPDKQATANDLYATYGQWADTAGETAITKNLFGRMLSERGYQRTHGEKGAIWKGLGLKNEKPAY